MAVNMLLRTVRLQHRAGSVRQRTDVAKKNQDQDIRSRLRQLTEQTRRTRRELEDLIKRPSGDRLRGFMHDRPQSFRRRRQRNGDK